VLTLLAETYLLFTTNAGAVAEEPLSFESAYAKAEQNVGSRIPFRSNLRFLQTSRVLGKLAAIVYDEEQLGAGKHLIEGRLVLVSLGSTIIVQSWPLSSWNVLEALRHHLTT
jgi:hypothetical protein